ncbi:MAG: S41 family peptidase [Erythrobacter sp.]|uniref:S41 family peptidase n=1 Tax=Erythrobacter sp. TaxID=1042 RepID=UPI00260E0937|nr:S41 family peptidase [Erythrobacter sp.]MDJ0979780.1 S41 family peptidase [Erythrobacter sp.]
MAFRRAALCSVLVLCLASCSGGSSSPPPPATSSPTPTPTPTVSAIDEQLAFAEDVLDEWYLFPNLLDNSIDTADFNDVQEYLNARVAPARAQDIDRFFTFATSIEEENALINSGASAGFGIRLGYDTFNNRVFILEAFENGNALGAGLDRGAELLGITTPGQAEQLVSALMASGGPQAVVNALGPSDAGVTRTLRFAQANGAVITANVTKSVFSLDPISDRYGALTLNDGGKLVGYLNLRTFIVSDAANQLRQAFATFQSAGITELIIDLRYNGGGLISVADTFGDLLGAGRVGQVWSETVYRDSKSDLNQTELFENESAAIAPTKIAFIGRNATASASELVINSMIPYIDPANIALIGENTFGKPVGQDGFDLAEFDLRIRATTIQTNNSQGSGEYYSGLASVIPNTCSAFDDISNPLGDVDEASIAVALDFLAGRPCNAIATAEAGVEAQQATGRQVALQPERPNAVQHHISGLF